MTVELREQGCSLIQEFSTLGLFQTFREHLDLEVVMLGFGTFLGRRWFNPYLLFLFENELEDCIDLSVAKDLSPGDHLRTRNSEFDIFLVLAGPRSVVPHPVQKAWKLPALEVRAVALGTISGIDVGAFAQILRGWVRSFVRRQAMKGTNESVAW